MVLGYRVAVTRGEARIRRRREKRRCWTRRSQGSWRKLGLMRGLEGSEDDCRTQHQSLFLVGSREKGEGGEKGLDLHERFL